MFSAWQSSKAVYDFDDIASVLSFCPPAGPGWCVLLHYLTFKVTGSVCYTQSLYSRYMIAKIDFTLRHRLQNGLPQVMILFSKAQPPTHWQHCPFLHYSISHTHTHTQPHRVPVDVVPCLITADPQERGPQRVGSGDTTVSADIDGVSRSTVTVATARVAPVL